MNPGEAKQAIHSSQAGANRPQEVRHGWDAVEAGVSRAIAAFKTLDLLDELGPTVYLGGYVRPDEITVQLKGINVWSLRDIALKHCELDHGGFPLKAGSRIIGELFLERVLLRGKKEETWGPAVGFRPRDMDKIHILADALRIATDAFKVRDYFRAQSLSTVLITNPGMSFVLPDKSDPQEILRLAFILRQRRPPSREQINLCMPAQGFGDFSPLLLYKENDQYQHIERWLDTRSPEEGGPDPGLCLEDLGLIMYPRQLDPGTILGVPALPRGALYEEQTPKIVSAKGYLSPVL